MISWSGGGGPVEGTQTQRGRNAGKFANGAPKARQENYTTAERVRQVMGRGRGNGRQKPSGGVGGKVERGGLYRWGEWNCIRRKTGEGAKSEKKTMAYTRSWSISLREQSVGSTMIGRGGKVNFLRRWGNSTIESGTKKPGKGRSRSGWQRNAD